MNYHGIIEWMKERAQDNKERERERVTPLLAISYKTKQASGYDL